MKTTIRSLVLSALALGVAAWLPTFALGEDETAAPSPENKKHGPAVAGKILAIDAKSIQVKSQKGETVTLKLTDTTTYGTKKQPQQFADFHVGDDVMVAYEKAADGSMVAKIVAKGHKGDHAKKKAQ